MKNVFVTLIGILCGGREENGDRGQSLVCYFHWCPVVTVERTYLVPSSVSSGGREGDRLLFLCRIKLLFKSSWYYLLFKKLSLASNRNKHEPLLRHHCHVNSLHSEK